MRKNLIIIFLLASAPALSESWEGSKAKVPSGTLMCEYFAIENAMGLDSTGGVGNLDSTLEKSACLYAPKELLVVVEKEASDADGVALVEVKIGRTTIWVAKDQVECCFN
ncbi:MAG: hypothetical protein ACI9NT_002041 [Bacteroidia bacterium]|jgi:hypothetical protein